MADKIYFCGQNKICITEHCSKGQELVGIPAASVPIKSRIPGPNDPEWGNPNIWVVNEPQFDQRKTYLEFTDGSTKTLIGRVELVRGCDKNE